MGQAHPASLCGCVLGGPPGEFDAVPEAIVPSCRPRRENNSQTRKFLASSLRNARLCAFLDESAIDSLATALEYHVFSAGDVVVKEGSPSSCVFIADTDGLDLVVRGSGVCEISRGQSFGHSSVLHRCPPTVSVVAARTAVGVWAADGRLFRRAVQSAVIQRVAELRAAIDSILHFDGLTPRELDVVCDESAIEVVQAGCKPRHFCAGSPYVYFIKSGKVRVLGDPASPQTEDALMGPGHCLCDRALFYDEPIEVAIDVFRRVELLRVNMMRVRQTLGSDLNAIRLQQTFIRNILLKSNLFTTWSALQIQLAMQTMELLEMQPETKGILPTRFLIIVDGSARIGRDPPKQWLRRGHWHGFPPVVPTDCHPDVDGSADVHDPHERPDRQNSSQDPMPNIITAGRFGCRLFAMSANHSFNKSYSFNSENQDMTKIRLVRVLSRVCIFRHLTQQQLEFLASGVQVRRCRKGDKPFLQGDNTNRSLYVVLSGEVRIVVDGRVVRKLVRYSYFGERAALFNEPRAATVEVSSPTGANFFAIDADKFLQVVGEDQVTSELLRYRVCLQDTGLELSDVQRLGVIGCGTSGVVHLVKAKSGFPYALKRVSKKDGRIPRQVQREIDVLAESDHPFIMHLVKVLEMPECVYLLTEYVAGGELHAAIRTISTVLSRSQAMFYLACMTLMLEALGEKDIVYRDLKPENLMLDSEGYLKLIDFGSAKKLGTSCLRTFTMVGTPHYMAPEVMRGKGYGTEVDVWALGVILYELVCGYLPFGDECESTCEVCKAVLAGDLQFPFELEEITRELIAGFLTPRPLNRLGCDARGYEEIKRAPFFSLDGLVAKNRTCVAEQTWREANYFSLIIRRELQPPIAPNLDIKNPQESERIDRLYNDAEDRNCHAKANR